MGAVHSLEFMRARCRSPRLPRALTSQERAVLELVALGYADMCIADRVMMSEQVVQRHLTHIFEKAGLMHDRDLDTRVAVTLAYFKSIGCEL